MSHLSHPPQKVDFSDMSEDRRARLAALRKGRNNTQPKPEEVPKEPTKEEVPDHDVDLLQPPTLTIGTKTVEALSAEIQQAILNESRQEANSVLPEESTKDTSILTKDLKKGISHYLQMAKSKTDAAILKIAQEQYQELVAHE